MDRHALNTSKHCALETRRYKNIRTHINKSYTLARNERYGEFLRLLGAEKSAESRAIIIRPQVVLREQNGEYLWKATYPLLKQTFTIKFRTDEPIERQLSNGTKVVTWFHIDKNELIETQNFEDGRTVKVTRQFDDDQLIVIMEMKNITSYRFFVASNSQHTIGTETSRRQSFVVKKESLPLESPPSSLPTFYIPEEKSSDDSVEICL